MHGSQNEQEHDKLSLENLAVRFSNSGAPKYTKCNGTLQQRPPNI